MDNKLQQETIDEMAKDQKTILGILQKMDQTSSDREDYHSIIDPLVLIEKLKISLRTLSRWKRNGDLVPGSLGGRDYYFVSDVIKAIRRNKPI